MLQFPICADIPDIYSRYYADSIGMFPRWGNEIVIIVGSPQ
jgi:hypothetical protein